MESPAALNLQQPAERAPAPPGEPPRRPVGLPAAGSVGPWRLGDVLCVEVADDDLVRDTVTGDRRLLVVQTDHATVGRSGDVPTCSDLTPAPRVGAALETLPGLVVPPLRRPAAA